MVIAAFTIRILNTGLQSDLLEIIIFLNKKIIGIEQLYRTWDFFLWDTFLYLKRFVIFKH